MATPVMMPRQGQSVETCILAEWHKKKGDTVKKGDILLSYETDKAAFELESPVSGTLLEVFYHNGDEVRVLSNIAVIGQPGEAVDEFRPGGETRETGEIAKKSDTFKSADRVPGDKTDEEIISYAGQSDEIRISPRAKKLAERLNVPIYKIKGTGPDGRITEKDIEFAAAVIRTTPLAAEVMEKENKTIGNTASGSGGLFRTADLISGSEYTEKDFVIKKVSNVRRIIAEKMHQSLSNSAQLTHHISADVRNILKYRNEFKSEPDQNTRKNITINDMVCYAVIQALKNKPDINSHFLGDSIKTFHHVHLGIAVDTERGLMVPALRNADELSLPQLSAGIKSLADQCRQGNINPELLVSTAASFTVTNLGVYGIEMFTPVLNLPQSGILGINTIIYRPADTGNGEMGFIPMIGMSLTYDHRAIDGAPASVFLKEVKQQIENFEFQK
jgi:pyruvate dehydrogenase E2 component (dihydrolipoamide acetyltransferase)